MNAKTGDYRGMIDLYRQTARQGHMVFTKGFIPAFARLGPQTILTWIFLEQLRLSFGIRVAINPSEKQPDSGTNKSILLQNKAMGLKE